MTSVLLKTRLEPDLRRGIAQNNRRAGLWSGQRPAQNLVVPGFKQVLSKTEVMEFGLYFAKFQCSSVQFTG